MPLLTINEICEHYKISRKTVERWMHRGLPVVKLNANNGSVRIEEYQLEKWLSGLNAEKIGDRIRWHEYELKHQISYDLASCQSNKNTFIQLVDECKLIYPHDYYIKLENGKEILISIQCSDGKTFRSQEFVDSQIESFIRQLHQENRKPYLLILDIDLGNADEEYTLHFDVTRFINKVVIKSQYILEFDIISYLQAFK
ncbi:helix-turn-helix domain-containing protein [Lysinibacillus sp. FSL K6-0057]|uniref:helix-turn-helix transcriptional regulator n=1 Tax=Lysinibacillus TaxID=400634 RepID=UPI0019677614|nr:helix-turn-helix domain-containing protein [Lysinibacillus fusiformis]QSB12322.1 helix-turn-helix domain-containing protein [Lysinibacillus fusiformis]